MSGRPVHLLAAAAIAAAASLVSVSAASAGCFSCGPSYTYAAPVAYYAAPVVYSYSYAAPVAYPAPCNCGYAAPSAPMYVVNQGPAYTAPVMINAAPTPLPPISYGYNYGYRGGYPIYSGAWHWHHRSPGYGYRGFGPRYGYRGYGYRGFDRRGFEHRGFGHQRYRYGAVKPHARFGMRPPHHPVPGLVQPMRNPTGPRPRMARPIKAKH
jgi:hypothetical protein